MFRKKEQIDDDRIVRCRQCGKIIVGKSKKIGLCENCVSKDAKVAAGGAGILALALKLRKPAAQFIKTIFKA